MRKILLLAVSLFMMTAPAIAQSDNLKPGTSILFAAPLAGVVYKQGNPGYTGTFVANGTSSVTVGNTATAITDTIAISLNTVGGTVGALPHVSTITAGTGFTIVGSASDTSTYNYAVIKNAP